MYSTIEIRVITPSDYEQVLEFLRLHFYSDEPLNLCDGQPQPDPEDEAINLGNIWHGTSVMAIIGENIAGVMVTGPKTKAHSKYLTNEAKNRNSRKWTKIACLLAKAEKVANVYERYNINEVLHIFARAVQPLWRGQRIGIRMLEKVMELGKQMGYTVLTSDCTSFYSARSMKSMGFDCINVLYYKDYKDAQGVQVFKPPPPHIGIHSYAKRL